MVQIHRPTDFVLIIGAMKSGTTSLFHLLSQHPQVAASAIKEPRYFSDPTVTSRGWDWYCNLWQWDPVAKRVALEASPDYTTFPTRKGVPSRIRAVREADFRFIYIMRHPIRQIASAVRHSLYAEWGTSLDEGIPAWMIDNVRYSMQIDQYVAVFPRESILLLTLEEFNRRPQAVLSRICAFAGIDAFRFEDPSYRYNSGELFEVPASVAGLLKLAPLRAAATKFLAPRTKQRIRNMLPRLTGSRRALGRHQLRPDEEAYVLAEIGQDLRRLHEVYGIDVRRRWSIDLSTVPNA